MKQQIECPSCAHKIDVSEVIFAQISEEVKKDFVKKSTEEKKELEVKLRKEISEETNEEITSYKEELAKKVEQVKELNKTKAELERAKREKDELKEKIEAESEQRLTLVLNSEKEKIRKELDEKNSLKVAEKEHVIEQLMTQLKEAQRKGEQGSMQIQGEIFEEAIEDWLKSNHPLDQILPIAKGSKGADCLQIVNTRTRLNCGSIYYESKRTKEFSSAWIEKFKNDMRQKGATIGILVTEAMPKDMERMGMREGIWICTYHDMKALSVALRESVILVADALASQENKGDKLSILYDYLTGNEFKMQVEAIVEGFTQMNTDLASEKRAMEGIWKKREKQIQKVTINTTHMYSSIKAIAGNSVGSISLLELSDNNTKEIE